MASGVSLLVKSDNEWLHGCCRIFSCQYSLNPFYAEGPTEITESLNQKSLSRDRDLNTQTLEYRPVDQASAREKEVVAGSHEGHALGTMASGSAVRISAMFAVT
jgi:hypothetical protein